MRHYRDAIPIVLVLSMLGIFSAFVARRPRTRKTGVVFVSPDRPLPPGGGVPIAAPLERRLKHDGWQPLPRARGRWQRGFVRMALVTLSPLAAGSRPPLAFARNQTVEFRYALPPQGRVVAAQVHVAGGTAYGNIPFNIVAGNEHREARAPALQPRFDLRYDLPPDCVALLNRRQQGATSLCFTALDAGSLDACTLAVAYTP